MNCRTRNCFLRQRPPRLPAVTELPLLNSNTVKRQALCIWRRLGEQEVLTFATTYFLHPLNRAAPLSHAPSSCVKDLARPHPHSFLPQVMMISPTLGTGLFIGTGQALAAGGPAWLLFSYIFISVLVYCLTTALAEIAAHSPFPNGTMVTHTYRYGSRHMGFSTAYLRWCSLAMLVPFEIISAMVNIGLWQPGIKVSSRVAIVMAVILGFNMLPDRLFRKSQALFTGLKLVTTIGLIIVSTYIAIRGIPGSPVHGFYYWRQPGPFNEFIFRGDLGRFLGLLECLLCSTITFAFIPELTVHDAEQLESESGASIFRTSRISNVILFVLYTLSSIATTLMSPYNDPRLTNSGKGAGYSPYIVGIKNAEIDVLPVIATALIFISSMASGRTFLYVSSRMLSSMAETGHAPKIFMRRNGWGVPYWSVFAANTFSWVALLCMVVSTSVLFNYLMFFITTAGYICWISSCIVYLRFRRTPDMVGTPVQRSSVQPFGTYFCLLTCSLLIIANIAQTGIVPHRHFNTRTVVGAPAAIGVFVVMYFGHRVNHLVRRQYPEREASRVEARGEMVERQPPGEGTVLQTISPGGEISTGTVSAPRT